VLSAAAPRAQAEIPTPEVDTVVWEELQTRTGDESRLSVSFASLMVLAGVIAAIAILTNNPVLVVGAMIVSPDYGPMAALVVFLTAFVVAFVAGAAGIIALGRARSGAVVGVLVLITTIPAAANVGVAFAVSTASEAWGALLILVMNLAGLLIGGVLVLLAAGVWVRPARGPEVLHRPPPGPLDGRDVVELVVRRVRGGIQLMHGLDDQPVGPQHADPVAMARVELDPAAQPRHPV
jgi:uncharacterized membrane protein